jgi:hypothetical protein
MTGSNAGPLRWNPVPDGELIVEHDQLAVHTSVGTACYMDELERRSRDWFACLERT